MTPVEFLISEVPDPEAARRFLDQLKEKHPSYEKKLVKNQALLSDVLVLVSCSPLFATTLLQDPEHIAWLGRERVDSSVRDKQSLLESLARFSMTHSLIEPNVVLARFRRRELMRIFLKDVRRLATVAEVTDEISNLADAILEHALRLSRQELENRFGQPQETDDRGRVLPAEICVVALGKLGSKELNYASDIDLLFIFSGIGKTSGSGTKGATSNLEYFSKLTESVIKLVGGQGGEGAAYRVDLRLRPHGRVGPLALSLSDTVRYYKTEAAAWERQVLIRSRASAGSKRIFHQFIETVLPFVFSKNVSVEEAYRDVGLSKQKIDTHNKTENGIDVKLGKGGIREIEFIAQALQLAHGGHDAWLRVSHTLISLTRLSEHGLISNEELTELFEAYSLLRHLEHILQIEQGLQTHLVPSDNGKQLLIARRMGFGNVSQFQLQVANKMANVHRVFQRIFNGHAGLETEGNKSSPVVEGKIVTTVKLQNLAETDSDKLLAKIRNAAPRFASIAETRPEILSSAFDRIEKIQSGGFSELLLDVVSKTKDLGEGLSTLRQHWTNCLVRIVAMDVDGQIGRRECKALQTELAEASISAALLIVTREMERRTGEKLDRLPIAVMGLGKLGGGGLDYDSDLDLVIAYDENPLQWNHALQVSEFIAKAVEIFTTVLSSVTRDGSLYRVDLRLRPYGSKGMNAISAEAFLAYMNSTAEVWELLAFVMLRFVGGDNSIGSELEAKLRTAIFERAAKLSVDELAAETRRVRLALEKQRSKPNRRKEVDLKYGAGGLLDIYFATRYLQLANSLPNQTNDRSTSGTLNVLVHRGVLSRENYDELSAGYEFLASLDHNLRLVVGRTSRVPAANVHALEVIADRMNLPSSSELLEQLNIHRLSVRTVFEAIVG